MERKILEQKTLLGQDKLRIKKIILTTLASCLIIGFGMIFYATYTKQDSIGYLGIVFIIIGFIIGWQYPNEPKESTIPLNLASKTF
jgi:FtsH-binding integral membrane protein